MQRIPIYKIPEYLRHRPGFVYPYAVYVPGFHYLQMDNFGNAVRIRVDAACVYCPSEVYYHAPWASQRYLFDS